MNTIKLLQKGVEGVTMRTPDPEFGFGDEDDDEDGNDAQNRFSSLLACVLT